jgi:hypothetical protein
MRCQVSYRIGERPGRLTPVLAGTLSIDITGLRFDGPRARHSRGRLFLLLVACGLALLLAFYMGSYLYLSRRGMREAKVYNLSGFLYIPATEVVQPSDLTRHYNRTRLFAPLSLADQVLFGAPPPLGRPCGLSD